MLFYPFMCQESIFAQSSVVFLSLKPLCLLGLEVNSGSQLWSALGILTTAILRGSVSS